MRVLIVHNRYRGTAPSGENLVVDQESEALRARGHEVELFERHSEDIASWSKVQRALVPVKLLWSEESRRSLAGVLEAYAPDVVHVHNTFPLITPSILRACRSAGVPVVATVHNYKLGCANGELYRDGHVCYDCLGKPPVPALLHGCYRNSRVATVPVVASTAVHAHGWRDLVSAFMFVSAAQRDLLRPVGLPQDRCFVKYNFVPRPPDRPERDPQAQVAFVGRLDAAKGTAFLMAAWDEFRRQRPDSPLKLVVGGGGAMADEVTAWAARPESAATMLGRLPRTGVFDLMAESRAVIVPSQWDETFGMVAVEAMASGTGVIATRRGAFPEIVTPGRTGTIITPTSLDEAAAAFGDVADDPDRWAAYGREAARVYEERFSPEVGIERLLEVYRYAIEHPVEPTAQRQVSS